MTHITIDHDADGAYALITRPGQAAERVTITPRDAVRLMSEAAQVVLVQDRLSSCRTDYRRGCASNCDYLDDVPPHFIGALGE